MKALTLWQPWASFVAHGLKTIETRSWGTNYTGWLAVHAAKTFPPGARQLCKSEPFSGWLKRLGLTIDTLPHGVVVCRAQLIYAFRITPASLIHEFDRQFGNFAHGRYAWVLGAIVAYPDPIPARGRQGLWNWDEPHFVRAVSVKKYEHKE
jgi:hypothetical protein